MTVTKTIVCISLAAIGFSSCQADNDYLTRETPGDSPIPFMPEIVPDGKLIHSGIFSPDLNEYYYTISDHGFTEFDVFVIRKKGGKWSSPRTAFFSTGYYEHGTSFSPDGRSIYFSSTRPAQVEGVLDTWHLWRSESIDGGWTEPEFVDIPNLRDKLVSHPSLSNDGTMYFHAGNPDYTELSIYSSKQLDGVFQDAVKLPSAINAGNGDQVTPFISPDEAYLLFERASEIHISYRERNGGWSVARPLGVAVNANGKGNPFISPDKKFLFFAAESVMQPGEAVKWSVFWVSTTAVFSAP